MGVYLVEYQDYPETFYIKGDGVNLLGQFPNVIYVGYGEEWKALLDEMVLIST